MTYEITDRDRQTRSGGAAPEKPKVQMHLDYIDGLRGLAISLVLMYHAWGGAHSPAAYWWNPLYSGAVGVNLFLLLSGFCLYWPLVRPVRPSPEPSLAAFAWRRAHRILPPYYIALGITTIWTVFLYTRGWYAPEGVETGLRAIWTTVAWHALMLHNLRPEHIFTLNSPFWSLPLEISLYIAMPILVVVARLRGILWAVVLAAVITLMYRILCDRVAGGTPGWRAAPELSFVVVDFLPGRLFEFALGMWAATLVAKGFSNRRRVPLTLLALACLAGTAWITQHFTRENPFVDALCGLGFFFLVLEVSQPPMAGRLIRLSIRSVLRLRPVVWLGQISYSLYLIHEPLLDIADRMITRLFHRDLFIFAAELLVFVPIVGLAALFHRCCERPFMNGPRWPSAPAQGTVPLETAVMR